MGQIAGSASVEIDAPVSVVFAVASDVERMPEWQTGLLATAVLESNRAGRARRVQIETAHGVAILRFDYRDPIRITWQQEAGDAAHFAGSWSFVAAGDRTRATYDVELDLGRGWGLLVTGPMKGSSVSDSSTPCRCAPATASRGVRRRTERERPFRQNMSARGEYGLTLERGGTNARRHPIGDHHQTARRRRQRSAR